MKPDRLDPEPETETETETFISPRSCAFPLDGSGLARPQFPFCLAEASDDFRSTTDARLVDRIGREVPPGVMWPLAIAEGERLHQSQEQLGQAGVALEIDVLVLDAASQALDEQVVRCPPAFTHADGDPFTLEDAGEDHAGERCPLVGLEDLGGTVGLSRLFQTVDAEPRLQPVGPPPRARATCVPVDEGHPVGAALCQAHGRAIGAPHRVRARDLDAASPIGINRVFGVGVARGRFRRHARKHQRSPSVVAPACDSPPGLAPSERPPGAGCRRTGVLGVDQP